MTTFANFADGFAGTFECTLEGLRVEAPKRRAPDAKPWHHFLWTVTLTYRGRTFMTAYRTGLGNGTRRGRPMEAPREGEQRVPMTLELARALKPYGRLTVSDTEGFVLLSRPPLGDVLMSLGLDAHSGEHMLFEDFANEFGLDTDSREAERTWRVCQETRGQLRKLFGADFDTFDTLVEEEDDHG